MELWPDPVFGLDPANPATGLDPDDAPWSWRLIGRPQDGGKTKAPPTQRSGWRRWYFIYERPDGSRVKVSADKDPETGKWFNPHLSSEQP